ncbi:nicotinate-nucleotide--dimethylbenzimidazole phosphoribosyltransferase [Henriciella aquimarina]|uniref:nicotinate-nucleotide--dimethylbenzimidazole phosphoribosyltransferase n=1 Tax=Henriciella aquimarina TaxID=545261 RepID=UPI001F3C39D6|nr:nicotinate-nucleotide--dimethylbenzimidazole phosphoribosyltransferase [Henriciella aquimarina]
MMKQTGSFETALRQAIDSKTKPVGSLGDMEALAARIARIQGSLVPVAETCRLTIFAGDHGMARAGVSAYPQDVTRQMVLNFLEGGAAATVFARTLGIDVQVADCGVAGDAIKHPDLLSYRVAAGTANAIDGPAMSAAERDRAFETGRALGAEGDHHAACFGEMGIGNTSSASLVAAKILGEPVTGLVGRGTGLEGDALDRKRALLVQAAGRTPDTLDAQTALMEYAGFEIVTMAGAMTGASEAGKMVLVDGFIATVAALCAREIAPGCEAAFIFAHRSAEAGHGRILDALEAKPLLDLDMRLGEGTGALLAWPLVQAAAAMLRDMASFDSAGVSGPA